MIKLMDWRSVALGLVLSVLAPAATAQGGFGAPDFDSQGSGAAPSRPAALPVFHKPIVLTATAGVPAAPASLTAVGGIDGYVDLSWEPSTVDVDGNAIDSVTYTVQRIIGSGSAETIAIGLTECRLRNFVGAEKQQMVYYAVFPVNCAGTGNYVTNSAAIIVGPAYSMPFKESFSNYSVDTSIEFFDSKWTMYSDTYFNDMASVDGDNGFIRFYTKTQYDQGRIATLRIHIDETAVHPTLSFWTTGWTNMRNLVTTLIDEGDGFVAVDSIVGTWGVSNAYTWGQVKVDLSSYRGKDIRIALNAEARSDFYTYFDCIEVKDERTVDLAAAIHTPGQAMLNDILSVSVNVANNAVNASGDYAVRLYRNDVRVATVEATALGAGADTTIVFTDVVTDPDLQYVSYHATVNIDGDEDLTNNVTDTVSIRVVDPLWPAPSALEGGRSEGSTAITLTWTAPVLNATEAATETFENYRVWTTGTIGSWTTLDGDGARAGTIYGADLYSTTAFPYQMKAASWFVVDAEYAKVSGYEAVSGIKYTASIFNVGGEQNDDWLISPALSGQAQLINFSAGSVRDDWGLDAFEVLVSYDGTDAADFTEVIGTETAVPVGWTEYTYYVPAGAKHFAIRSTGTRAYMLRVDDVTFCAADGTAKTYTLEGYNVYRDGAKINTETVTETTYTDATADAAVDHFYRVTALYAGGESGYTNRVEIGASNLSGVELERGGALAPRVCADGRVICISGAEGQPVGIYRADGACVYTGTGNARVSATTGVYIVKVGTAVSKLIIR